jgi:iron complex transport system ATP-binding protein
MLHFQEVHIGRNETLFSIGELQLQRGKLYALVGSNGCGKSTFLKTTLGQLNPFKGKIYHEEKSIHSFSNQEIAKRIAFVSSKFDGVQHLSGIEYIALGRAPYTNFLGKLTSHDKEIISSVIDELKIAHLSNKDTLQMSDGERQILSIARALVQKTPFILMDEPTSFLDYSNRVHVYSLLQEIVTNRDVCILHSTHDIDMALNFVDTFLIVEKENKQLIELQKAQKESIIQLAFPELL